MTMSDSKTAVWRLLPGARGYEVCSVGGRVRSVDRLLDDGRFAKGKELTPKRTGKNRYWRVRYTDDEGIPRDRPVHQLVLEAHRELRPPGMEACHADDNPDNNDLDNLRWDTPAANDADRSRNRQPAPPQEKPKPLCIICGEPFSTNGRRCRPCIVALSATAAKMLQSGVPLEKAAAQLEYPSPEGLHTLAQRHAGYGLPWSRRVRRRLAAWMTGGDAK